MKNQHLKTGEEKNCPVCENVFYIQSYLLKSGRKKFCSKECLYKSGVQTNTFQKGHIYLVPKESRGHSEETKKKISANSGVRGKKPHNWIEDRTKVKLDKERGGPLHKEWSKKVKKRDGWCCRINNDDCTSNVQAHHILSWAEYVELRYDINNGITLCNIHHPRKREDEKRMAEYFKQLILN